VKLGTGAIGKIVTGSKIVLHPTQRKATISAVSNPVSSRRRIGVIALEGLAVATVATLLVVLGMRLVRGLDSAVVAGIALFAGAAGYLFADLATGTVHWFCDTFFEETTPLIGPLVIVPFREHHRDPLAMTGHGFLELAGNSCLALAPVLGLTLWLGPADPPSPLGAALYPFVFVLAISAAATNVFHRWAHDPSPPRIAQALQRAGLILRPERHAAHHAPPHDAAYCVTSGWMNALLDRVRFFARAERALVAIGLRRASE
jgi:ubiquitin-conjugating enzyme E2 variant